MVYGTLKQVARSRNGRAACVPGRLWDNGSYPALELGPPGGPRVAGLVFAVSPEELRQFDAYEGVAHAWYRRVKACSTDGEVVWVYVGGRCLADANKPGSPWKPLQPGAEGVVSWDRVLPISA